jgi:spore maturation protein CgeB
MKIAIIFDKKRADTMGIYFERALRETSHSYRHFWLKDAGGIKPQFDLYLRIDDGDYSHDLPVGLKPSVFWVSDTHLAEPFKAIVRQARHYDYVFCGMKDGVEVFRKKGIVARWSPAACDPDIHKRLDVPKRFDIGFVGNDGGIPRKFYLEEIRERYPDSFLGTAPYTKMSEIYSASRIGFNYLRTSESITMRCMEIMSCGAMLLVNRASDGSFEDLGFKDTESAVFYDSPRRLFELIDYYLKNDAERTRIAEAGHQLAVAKHTYGHRLQEMLACL